VKTLSFNRTSHSHQANTAIPSDEELVVRLRWREEAALHTLYDRYSRLVYTIALRITGDRLASEEVVQDVFQAAWLGAGGFQAGGNLPAWLSGITRHRAIDLTRTRRARARAREEPLTTNRADTTADDTAETLALRELIRSALRQLPPAQRAALELAYYSGLSAAEIAQQLNEPLGTIKSRLRLGLARMRAELQNMRE
jgi:RNA polymerase sigma-70 factor (ECF subfamily)